jgi:hypothetical protein
MTTFWLTFMDQEATSDAHMAIVILTRPDLLRLEQVPCRDIEPAGTCLHQLIAGDGGRSRLAGTRNARGSDNYRKKRYSHW